MKQPSLADYNRCMGTDAMPTVYIVVAELEPVIDVLNAEMGEKYAHFYCRQRVNYGFDLEGSAEEKSPFAKPFGRGSRI
ncbi:MAG: hypothetical protein PUD59_02475 [bacterium]|nr:hypothetical protein [bacterium]